MQTVMDKGKNLQDEFYLIQEVGTYENVRKTPLTQMVSEV